MTKRVKDVMRTHVVTVRPDDSVRHALGLMNTHHVRQLPVVEAGYLVGILTDRDIRLHVEFMGDRVETEGDFNRGLDVLVEGVMTIDVDVLHPEQTLDDAAALFIQQKFGGAPVVDRSVSHNGEAPVVGIVTYIDLLEEFRRLMTKH
ncbi:MAG: CBS domain-containing protein [Bryobacterales bacterium]|nr:CBS domain-containing protein [Bryobacterales bacterium]